MLTPYEKALELLLENTEKLPTEKVFIWNALGRVLAEDIKADTDKPPFDNSAMDGYAVRGEDVEEAPTRLKLIGELPAGGDANLKVEKGTAVKIFTGAPMPEGADTIVPVEFTKLEGEYVLVEKAFKKGSNVRLKGEEVKKGEVILKSGARIRSYEVGLMASVGKVMVEVSRKPRVAILSTGDEIRELGEALEKPSHIRSSNNHALYAGALEMGCDVVHIGIVRDEPEEIERVLKDVESFDLFISTGGVSVGEKDFVQKLVKEMGFEVLFHKLRIKPAKPVLLAKKGRSLFFGLPGNPVSCIMAFDLLVKPAIKKMQGLQDCTPPIYKAELLRDYSRKDAERREFVRANFWHKDGRLLCDYSPKTQSHMLTSYVGTNCYMVVYEEIKDLKAGQEVDIIPFDWL